jgi:hypothetical protein
VARAEVRLSDLNGPRGGIDKRCQVDLRPDGSGWLVVAAIFNDWRYALDHALARFQRLLLARLGSREQQSRRLRSLAQLLRDILDPVLRLKLLRLRVGLAEADARVAEGESIVLAAAVEHWGLQSAMFRSAVAS